MARGGVRGQISSLLFLWLNNSFNPRVIIFLDRVIMASQTQGIQQLLAAEKKAAEKVRSPSTLRGSSWPDVINIQVQEARKRKAKRLKQAKEEAQAEIERFKAEKEKAFHEKERTHQGSKYVSCLSVNSSDELFL